MPWSSHDIQRRGLGGAETAVVRVAAGLTALGYAVTVYANVTEEEPVDDVTYLPRDEFDSTRPRTAVISSRDPEIFEARLPADKTLLWVHDPDAGQELKPEHADNVDYLVGLSAWHAERLRSSHPFAADKVVRIAHGLDQRLFSRPAERRPAVISTCQPERGLDVLLELWPQVRDAVPQSELLCCYAPYADYEPAWHPKIVTHRKQVRALTRQAGVRLLGPLPQPEMARWMLRSRVYAHMSWHTPSGSRLFESFCISAAEAQAAGLWTVVSSWGALPETVRVGALIDGEEAPGPAWRAAFVDQIVRGLTDRQVQERAEREGPQAVRELTWRRAAGAFAGLIGPGSGT